MARSSVLIVEDEELMRSILRQLLSDAGFDVFTADGGETALKLFGVNEIDVVVTDIKMHGINGLELLEQIREISPDTPVIVMTAFSSVDSAIGALRKGAYDYVTKPFVNEYLVQTIRNAAERNDLTKENRRLRGEIIGREELSGIVGMSEPMLDLLRLVGKVADTTATVLIVGETGTGKELIARALHFKSGRAGKPFLAVNCGAIPESLLESELFGHVKGAFTGAAADNKGLFRSAAGGTLFLDEIGEMPIHLQVKLLRVLQEKEVSPVGSSSSFAIDARIVAATNNDIEAEIAAGRFREDLYYRLNVIQLDVPPLRERREDIPLLAKHFSAGRHIENDSLRILTAYDWPGNVRELENCIERAAVLSRGTITPDDLPPKLLAKKNSAGGTGQTLEEIERSHILGVLEQVGNDKSTAATVLGIDLSTLYRKLKRFED